MNIRNRRRIAWLVGAFLGGLGVFAMAQGIMPGVVFSFVLVALALISAAKGYHGGTLYLWLVIPFGLSSSCSVPTPAGPVPVQGTQEEVRALSGQWEGRYWSKATGRRGTIRFSLPERADTGYGEVEITFSPALRLARDAQAKDGRDPEPCPFLDITLVRVSGDQVRGTMAPYWDPDCDCRAQTVFEGRLAGDQITGTFSTQRASSDRRLLTGKWQVTRGGRS